MPVSRCTIIKGIDAVAFPRIAEESLVVPLWRKANIIALSPNVLSGVARTSKQLAQSGRGNMLPHVRFWGQSGHGLDVMKCPLMTQSGHCAANVHF